MRPADFKGKWVVLDFWGYWCGPCVGRSLPGWMDFAADHDKFVILTIHDPEATDFAMLDALTRLLAPLGMTYVVRDEAVVLTTAP